MTPPEPRGGEGLQITMQDVRLAAGEGKLSAHDVLNAVNAILRNRRPSSPPSGGGNPLSATGLDDSEGAEIDGNGGWPSREAVVALLSSADECGQIQGPQWIDMTADDLIALFHTGETKGDGRG
jgi:hypothetical protein